MFSALRKVLIQDSHETNATESEQNNPSFITEPSKIVTLLQQIIASPPLCTVTLPNCHKTFFTSILDVQKEKGRVIFDELMPASGNHQLSQWGTLKFATFINGVHLTFQLKEIIQETSLNRTVYTALLPESIYYPQRRSSPRIQADANTISFQGISKDTGLLLKGYVWDLSRSGLCFTSSHTGNHIHGGDWLTNCLIRLPDENTFSFDLSVRSIRRNGFNSPQRQIGGFFNGLSPQNQNKLDRTICALERRQIRKRKN